LLKQFGVIAFFDGTILQHSLTTLLIDESGRIIDRADGSRWEPEHFLSRILPREGGGA
jgi:protein SCO1/2